MAALASPARNCFAACVTRSSYVGCVCANAVAAARQIKPAKNINTLRFRLSTNRLSTLRLRVFGLLSIAAQCLRKSTTVTRAIFRSAPNVREHRETKMPDEERLQDAVR